MPPHLLEHAEPAISEENKTKRTHLMFLEASVLSCTLVCPIFELPVIIFSSCEEVEMKHQPGHRPTLPKPIPVSTVYSSIEQSYFSGWDVC